MYLIFPLGGGVTPLQFTKIFGMRKLVETIVKHQFCDDKFSRFDRWTERQIHARVIYMVLCGLYDWMKVITRWG